jgi:hypothetical protein
VSPPGAAWRTVRSPIAGLSAEALFHRHFPTPYDQRQDVWISSPLLVGNLNALIGDRIDAFALPQRHDRDKARRIVRVGGDVVDWRQRLPELVIMPGHVGDQAAANQGHQRQRDPAPVGAC